jgi:hypothetical protein
VITPLDTYYTIRSFINSASQCKMQVDHPSGSTTPLLKALGSVWAPFCVKGQFTPHYNPNQTLFKSSTVSKLNVSELIAAATQSPFGRGTETILDTNVRDSPEITADKLDLAGLEIINHGILGWVMNMCPNTPIEFEPYKLVIYSKAGTSTSTVTPCALTATSAPSS